MKKTLEDIFLSILFIFIGIPIGVFLSMNDWIEKVDKDPYCKTESAELHGKNFEVTRCWKVVEIKK